MPGSDRSNVLTIAQSVPGAWPPIRALMRLMSSQATFEPVSAKTQPVSGHTTCQIPDIENSSLKACLEHGQQYRPLMRLMSSQATFEPVSAKTQPVSGHTTCQI